MPTTGLILLIIGALITAVNAYLSWLRSPIHRVRGGTRETYRWVSGIPVLGSLLLWISIPLLDSTSLRWLAAIASLADTGGIHWFIASMWWQRRRERSQRM